VPTSGSIRPYALAGFGIAEVTQDVTFLVNGSDVTGSLNTQYGVQLGTDLSGSFTKPMFTMGAGATWSGWQRLVIDLQYRFGRILAEDEGININRLGVGVGVRF
jgi:opacity protein-like surface antigen